MEEKSRFIAYVYDNDYVEIRKLVQHYPSIETGGDLFGLWQDDKSVVIQLFIGPGKECRRTTTSFHQDVAYLQKVGEVITKKEGLCNVGEWHSHHQIGMPRPSGADKRTVLSNMPQLGLDRFVLFIASIENSEKKKRSRNIQLKDITLRCFMFREDLHHEEQPIEGKIVIIKENNPVHLKYEAQDLIKQGAEEPPPKEKALDTTKEKKRKESEKQGSFGSKPPAGNQSGPPRDENTSPNSGGKEKPSDQRKNDITRQTTQSASPSYPPTQSPPRSSQGQVPSTYNQPHSSQGQYPSNQSQPRSNLGQVPYGQSQSRSNQAQGTSSQRPPHSKEGQVPYSQSQPGFNQRQPRSNEGQGTYSQSQPRSNLGQIPYSQSHPGFNQRQPCSNEGQVPYSQSQPGFNQAQGTSSQRQPRSNQAQVPSGQSQPRSSQASQSHSSNPSLLNPTAAPVDGMTGNGFF